MRPAGTLCVGDVISENGNRRMVKDVFRHEKCPGAKSEGRARIGEIWVAVVPIGAKGGRTIWIYDVESYVSVI